VVKTASSRLIDFNSVLTIVNLLVMALLLYGLSQLGDANPYMDVETIVLALLLCVQTHIALFFERKRRDPFVILLAFTMICFFSLRIFTLAVYPYSNVFVRFPYDAGDSNYALIFILLANTCLYAGLYKVNVSVSPINCDKWKATTPARALVLLLAVGLFAYTKGRYWTTDVPRVFLFLEVLVYPATMFLMVFAYCLAFARSLGRLFTVTIIALVVIDLLLHSLAGSRGAILDAILQLMVVLLALRGSMSLRKSYVISGVVLMPVLILLMVGVFFVSTFIRVNRGMQGSFDISQAMDLSGKALSSASTAKLGDVVLPPVFARAGYFDYSAEIIAHGEEYGGVLNLFTYFKSLVDNLLTPGFDVFDQPRISNALRFVYSSRGTPSKVEVAEAYHSDQLGLYGELYALFGYASLPLFFGLAFSLKRIYVKIKGKNPFDLTLKRIIILIAFGWILNSYGFDWIIIETLVFWASVWMYRFFFRVRLCEEPLVTG
jgi:hypothetical protein